MTGKLSIALVDDDDAVLDSLRLYFTGMGHVVAAFTEARSLLDALAAGLKPDCIVSDIRMPGLSGLELQGELARRGKHPPLILITGHGDIEMAVTARGGREVIWRDDEAQRVIFHTDRGATYTAKGFRMLCSKLGIRQSMGRVGSCFDNAAAEAFFSSLEWEVLSRNTFSDTLQARAVVIDWCYTFYNHQRRHSAADGLSPVNYEIRENRQEPEAA